MKKLVSVVVRTYNEARHLNELLTSINSQHSEVFNIEVVIVDSGSVDETLEIAEKHDARITHINKADFTFGRSLNLGCAFAKGDFLIFVSGHCIPTNNLWLHNLVLPLLEKKCQYTYGRQIGRDTTKFSEQQLLEKYFPIESCLPQDGFFCNNANAAISRTIWKEFEFDETLTGLEDMHTAKKICQSGQKIGYVADAVVYHIHDEKWIQVKNRYEREAIALQQIMPEIHISFLDMLRFIVVGILKDFKASFRKRVFFKEVTSIIQFRTLQFFGAYTGNHIHRKMSHQAKMKYFYPRIGVVDKSSKSEKNKNNTSNQGLS